MMLKFYPCIVYYDLVSNQYLLVQSLKKAKTKAMNEIGSKLAMKIPERRQ